MLSESSTGVGEQILEWALDLGPKFVVGTLLLFLLALLFTVIERPTRTGSKRSDPPPPDVGPSGNGDGGDNGGDNGGGE